MPVPVWSRRLPVGDAVTWEAAMRWAWIRAWETGRKYRVYGYEIQGCPGLGWHPGRWAYAVGRVPE